MVDGLCPHNCHLYRRPRGKTSNQYERERRAGERIGIRQGLDISGVKV
jgi:hypothetical protein